MFMDLLRQRRSVRKFLSRPVEEEKIALIKEALLRAPTSRNRRPWQFVLVDDPLLLSQLSRAKSHGTSFLTSSPLAVVIAADPRVSDVWVEDCSIAAIIVQLAAEELGLKSCWAQLRLRQTEEQVSSSDYVRQLVGLPTGFEVPVVIALGYPDEEKAGHPRASLPDRQLHLNRWSEFP